MCKERLHQIVEEEINGAREKNLELEWKPMMEHSFARWSQSNTRSFTCRCELHTPHCNAVVTPNKIIVSNCGNSRTALFFVGVAIPLSSDQKSPWNVIYVQSHR